ncbi:hypothetical protein H8E77_20110 [bacterium]|nr:hypothetical protein [bacterium]
MKDEYKPKKQFVNELAELRQRITELEASEIDRKQAENKLNEHSERME